MKRTIKYIKVVLIMPVVILALFSCRKFKGEQEVPSYIRIDSFALVHNPNLEEGYLTQNFSDVWVYVDGKSIGCFELPAVVPVLVSGKHSLTLSPGIKYNGVSGTRGANPFLSPYKEAGVEFIIDSVVAIYPETYYYDNTEFTWKEDFEDGYSSLLPTGKSDTSLFVTGVEPTSPLYGHAVGVGYVDSEHPVLEVATNKGVTEGYELPASNIPVFLEIDYNTNISIGVGLFIQMTSGEKIQNPVVVINPSNGVWKKMYINFTPVTNRYTGVDFYNVYLRVDNNDEVADPEIKIDNLKLMYKNLK